MWEIFYAYQIAYFSTGNVRFSQKAIFTAFYRYFNIVLLDMSQKIYKFARKVYNYIQKIYGKFESS